MRVVKKYARCATSGPPITENTCGESTAAMEERKAAKFAAVNMFKDVYAMKLWRWVALLLHIDVFAEQYFHRISAADAPERWYCPANQARCEGLVYGPFVHGAICFKEDVAYCVDCFSFHSRYHGLCPNC